jgi:hypothetical protein
MRLLIEEILDAEGKKALRVEIAGVEALPIKANDALWLLSDDQKTRRRTICVDARVLATASGIVGILDVVDATSGDLLQDVWNQRQRDLFDPCVFQKFTSEEAIVVARPCACGDPSVDDYEHAADRCTRKKPPAPPPAPELPRSRVVRLASGQARDSDSCACGSPTRTGYRHGATSCTREDVATVADRVASADEVAAALSNEVAEDLPTPLPLKSVPPSKKSAPAPPIPRVRFISPPGAPTQCPRCGEKYRHVEQSTKPGVIMMSLCKCNSGTGPSP